MTDTAVQQSDLATSPDWTNFDIGRSMALLRNGNEEQRRVCLQRLHRRWYHATPAQMKGLLERAGVPAEALALIEPICKGCRICRLFEKPGLDNTSIDKFQRRHSG